MTARRSTAASQGGKSVNLALTGHALEFGGVVDFGDDVPFVALERRLDEERAVAGHVGDRGRFSRVEQAFPLPSAAISFSKRDDLRRRRAATW